MTEYLLNASGSVNYRNLINRNGDYLQSSSYIYNSEGHKIKEYAHTAKDSSLIYYGSWNGPNLMHYEYPSGETIVDVVYTNIPDNRNLGFFQFQKNRSYHLIQKEIVKSRGSVQTNEYTYQFDSENRPAVIVITQDGMKLYEKHYQYW